MKKAISNLLIFGYITTLTFVAFICHTATNLTQKAKNILKIFFMLLISSIGAYFITKGNEIPYWIVALLIAGSCYCTWFIFTKLILYKE